MKICIFASSSDEIDSSFADSAFNLSQRLAQEGHSLVFGGGNHGLMGACARGFRKGNGKIIGVSPQLFDQGDILYKQCDELIITSDMVSRKTRMIELADCFIVLAGGYGTLDELFEVVVGKQLGYHHKPIIVYNVNGYYDSLLKFCDELQEKGFSRKSEEKLFEVFQTVNEVTDFLR